VVEVHTNRRKRYGPRVWTLKKDITHMSVIYSDGAREKALSLEDECDGVASMKQNECESKT
jgi:hypothetical protein